MSGFIVLSRVILYFYRVKRHSNVTDVVNHKEGGEYCQDFFKARISFRMSEAEVLDFRRPKEKRYLVAKPAEPKDKHRFENESLRFFCSGLEPQASLHCCFKYLSARASAASGLSVARDSTVSQLEKPFFLSPLNPGR